MKVTIRFSVIAGVLAAVICSSALEGAAQQQPILGCVKAGTGLLRIPPPNEGCKAQETPLGFNDLPLLVALKTQVDALTSALAAETAARQAADAALQASINNEAAARAAADASEAAARQAADAALRLLYIDPLLPEIRSGPVNRIYVKQFDFDVDAHPQVQTFVAECDGSDHVIAGTYQNLAYNTNLFSGTSYTGDQFFSVTLAVSVVDEVHVTITCMGFRD